MLSLGFHGQLKWRRIKRKRLGISRFIRIYLLKCPVWFPGIRQRNLRIFDWISGGSSNHRNAQRSRVNIVVLRIPCFRHSNLKNLFALSYAIRTKVCFSPVLYVQTHGFPCQQTFLFYCYYFCQISWLIHIKSFIGRNIICQ